MDGSHFDSMQFILTVSLVSSVTIGSLASGVQRLLNLDVRFVSNCIVAAAATVPIALLSSSRVGEGAALVKDYGLISMSVAIIVTVAVVMAFAQQAWNRAGFGAMHLTERSMANCCVGVAAIPTYFVFWLGGGVLTFLSDLSV